MSIVERFHSFMDKTMLAVTLGLVPTGIFTVFGIYAMVLNHMISEDFGISIMPLSIIFSLIALFIIYYFDNKKAQQDFSNVRSES